MLQYVVYIIHRTQYKIFQTSPMLGKQLVYRDYLFLFLHCYNIVPWDHISPDKSGMGKFGSQ